MKIMKKIWSVFKTFFSKNGNTNNFKTGDSGNINTGFQFFIGERGNKRSKTNKNKEKGIVSMNYAEALVYFDNKVEKLNKQINKVCGSLLNNVDTITQSVRNEIYLKSSETIILLIDRSLKKVISFIFFICLDHENFEKAKQCNLSEKELTAVNVQHDIISGQYNAYVVDIDAQGKAILLFDALFTRLLKFAKNGVFFTNWCACACTAQGRSLCEKLGMSKMGKHKLANNDDVYYASATEILLKADIFKSNSTNKRYKKYKELVSLYSEMNK